MKGIRNDYHGYIEVFNHYHNDSTINDSYAKLYIEIYRKYKENLISVEELKIEKAKLKSLARVNNDAITISNAIFAFAALILTILATGLFTVYSGSDSNKDMIYIIELMLIYAGLIFIFMLPYKKSIKNYSFKSDVFNFSLNIIDDIEKEMKYEEELKKVANEVAVTVQQEEQLKHKSKQTNGNWNVEINMSSVFDTIESVYRAGKFVRKMFRRKK